MRLATSSDRPQAAAFAPQPLVGAALAGVAGGGAHGAAAGVPPLVPCRDLLFDRSAALDDAIDVVDGPRVSAISIGKSGLQRCANVLQPVRN